MNETEKIKKVLLKIKPIISKKYNVNAIGIFGSYVRQEQKKDSDLDILVDFSKTVGLFKFLELEEYLSENLNLKIDLVSKGALKLNIGKNILNEVEMI
ncbi:nucleotidyltransferase family protein [Candidatus Margulisiibacteriota bacterium]